MVAIALLLAVACYAGAAALAITPFARPVGPPFRGVVIALTLGVLAHAGAMAAAARFAGGVPVSGLGPALSFAGLALAVALLLTELLARDATLSLIGAPLAAVVTAVAIDVGWRPFAQPRGAQGAWLVSHVAFSFIGIAALATAAAAGALYLVERHELKSRRFGSIFRSFPPLETLDHVNHMGAVTAWIALTLGVALAASYSAAYGGLDGPRVVWGIVAWLAAGALAAGRQLGGWRARRAAVAAAVAFGLVVASYVAARAVEARPGHFL
jgi:HemX protein